MQVLAAGGFVPEFEEDRFKPHFKPRFKPRFKPHVTLARKAGAAGAAGFPPVPWLATQMVLAESFTGTGKYRIIASHQLDHGAPAPAKI